MTKLLDSPVHILMKIIILILLLGHGSGQIFKGDIQKTIPT